ncbi:hypothetical protein Csa_015149 [Cucumis sativus]|uniref:Uncharacterized protein n=1 Tax=Cucumis sativus TaxID=3659 RepID=A0A0A0L078_CUCSA|nr:hypothetical protein Csa_015149 [Cucumis sativus]
MSILGSKIFNLKNWSQITKSFLSFLNSLRTLLSFVNPFVSSSSQSQFCALSFSPSVSLRFSSYSDGHPKGFLKI